MIVQAADLSTASVLIVDDDAQLCELLTRFLGAEGLKVRSIPSGAQGVDCALSGGYDLVVLDVMLPGMDGFEVLRRIRVQSNIPILMLTARGDDLDRILGLEIGADDYLPKPFNARELAARVRAILRRARSVDAGARVQGIVPLSAGDLQLNAAARTVHRGTQAINLTAVEFDLLEKLMRSAGRVVGRDELTREVLGREFSPFDRSIDTHIWNLRRKVGPYDDGTERIKGIRGVGYLLAVANPAELG